MRDAVICEPLRTPVGGFGGSLRDVPAQDLAATDIRAPHGGPIALAGARIHVLPAGHRFDLTGRRPSNAGAAAEERGRAA